ncbi:MAG TPA: ABC transporter permease [Crinalium sp.]|jgi:NitT/TauT family transport system permease protein
MILRRLFALILELWAVLHQSQSSWPPSGSSLNGLSSETTASDRRLDASPSPSQGKRWGWLVSPDVMAPLGVGLLFLVIWEVGVRLSGVAPYLLPGPLLVLQTLFQEWGTLFPSLLVTLKITLVAFIVAIASGLFVAILFTQSKWIERSFFPYAVILQTTPIVAIAPLIILWVRQVVPDDRSTFVSLVICAWIVAFFPILSNTTLGLNSADHNLLNLFQLYRASRWQTLLYLRLPSALPYFLGGLRISGGLALIGAVVAEFVAGTGGTQSGIAYQILMSSFNLQIPRMFAALLMTTVLGVAIFVALTLLSDFLLRHWHESAVKREN